MLPLFIEGMIFGVAILGVAEFARYSVRHGVTIQRALLTVFACAILLFSFYDLALRDWTLVEVSWDPQYNLHLQKTIWSLKSNSMIAFGFCIGFVVFRWLVIKFEPDVKTPY